MHDGGGGRGGCAGASPPVLVYLLFQRHLISGLAMGAEK
jgi:ABC-type glycerol-3-phosphate transport system permease component